MLEDVIGGHLFTARSLIEAEVFSDFIEMAHHLLDSSYKDPAASLIGAVLEDGLRRVAQARAVGFKPKAGIQELNEALSKAGVYNAIAKARVESWRLIRNKADHGEFGEFDVAVVDQMIDGVANLLGTHLV